MSNQKLVAFSLISLLAIPHQTRADSTGRLVEILRTHDSAKVRAQAAIGLGRHRGRRALSALLGALSDRDESVRAAAVHALGELGDARALFHLERLAAAKGNVSAKLASHARRAIQTISREAGKIHTVLTISRVQNRSREGGTALAETFGEALREELDHIPGVLCSRSGNVHLGAGQRFARHRSFYDVKAVILDVSHRAGARRTRFSGKATISVRSLSSKGKTVSITVQSTIKGLGQYGSVDKPLHLGELAIQLAKDARAKVEQMIRRGPAMRAATKKNQMATKKKKAR